MVIAARTLFVLPWHIYTKAKLTPLAEKTYTPKNISFAYQVNHSTAYWRTLCINDRGICSLRLQIYIIVPLGKKCLIIISLCTKLVLYTRIRAISMSTVKRFPRMYFVMFIMQISFHKWSASYTWHPNSCLPCLGVSWRIWNWTALDNSDHCQSCCVTLGFLNEYGDTMFCIYNDLLWHYILCTVFLILYTTFLIFKFPLFLANLWYNLVYRCRTN